MIPKEKGLQASQPDQVSHPRCSNSQTTAGTLLADVEKLSITPVDLLDISGATKAPHIFAVYETKIKGNVESFSLEETILKSVPARFTVTWFGPKRVSIRSPSYFKPIFVLFFEYEENKRILRVRVNSSAPYAEMATRSHLRNLIQNRDWKYGSLFEDLHEFIMKTRKGEEEKPADDSRLAMYPEVFDLDVNNETLAPLANKFEEQEQIALLSQLYVEDDCDISSFEVVCNMIIAPPGSSPIDLLYAVLPAPVMSFLIKKLYAFCNPGNSKFVKCPRCHADLATTFEREFSSCTCSSCGCAFCYLCDCEPHWPMSCEEYKRWTDRWDTQYFLEKNHIVGDGQVRLCLFCEEVFQICAEAHRQRFEKNENENFKKYVANYFSSKKEQRKMNETRNL
ncbi:unnamed protein product, partial [Cylicostephanus goldi]